MNQSNKYITGIGFWIGAAVFSLINIFKIFTNSNILTYDYIMTGVAVFFIVLSLILMRKTKKEDNGKSNGKYKYGIGFWIGGGIYSLINMIMNLLNVPQSDILNYNFLNYHNIF